jgi:hypothetical protein
MRLHLLPLFSVNPPNPTDILFPILKDFKVGRTTSQMIEKTNSESASYLYGRLVN